MSSLIVANNKIASFVCKTRENIGREWKRHDSKFDHLYIQLGCKQTQLLARIVVFSINHCGSFNMENGHVCRCPSGGILFYTTNLFDQRRSNDFGLIKVDNFVTNGKSNRERIEVKLWHQNLDCLF